jgi:hypothetical protein
MVGGYRPAGDTQPPLLPGQRGLLGLVGVEEVDTAKQVKAVQR